MTRLLIVDDEPPILRAISIALGAHDYEVDVASTGKQAIAKFSEHDYSAVVLDLGLPDTDGLTVISKIRAISTSVPIIVLSAWQEIETRVTALDLGADDYIPKPFGMPELLARIRVALRHSQQHIAGRPESPVVQQGAVTINRDERTVSVHGKQVDLTRTQFEVLHFLAQHPSRVLTHRAITTAVWGVDADVDPQNLRVVISQIRKRIEDDPSAPQRIRTELSVGYRFQAVD